MTRTAFFGCLFAAFFGWGCACPRGAGRSFEPRNDTFAFANGLRWEYEFSGDKVLTRKSEPPPEYSLRCFPMARAAREFFYHARFRPELPPRGREENIELIRAVLHRNSRCPAKPAERIEIPGFANLHDFSSEYGEVLKRQCGGATRSFFQRGNWRMVFPISRARQRKTAENFLKDLSAGRIPIAHIYRFPNTTLNHALLIYAAEEQTRSIEFLAYDPNDPQKIARLTFDRVTGVFGFERNRYFGGGAVKVYEVYRGVFY